MIEVRRSEERGQADHGWLDSRHTFSFGEYFDRAHMGFGYLRVMNEDRVAPGRGFGTHGHRDMEIVSWVLDGTLEHEDGMGNGSRMTPGEVQLMSAGAGVTHSEFNGSGDAELHFLQMWITPAEQGTPPRYEQRSFDRDDLSGRLRLVVSPDGSDGSLTIAQDARLHVGRLDGQDRIEFPLGADRVAWLHVARGDVSLNNARPGNARFNNTRLRAGDGAGIRDESVITLTDARDCEVLLWDMPAKSMAPRS